MCRAYCTPRWPRPPMPSTATRSPAFAGAFRSALNVVSPAHSSGAASADERLSEIAISTEFAITARPSEETDTHALTNRPALDTGAEGIDSPDHFMPWHARPANWKEAFHRARIRMAYAAGLDTDSN